MQASQTIDPMVHSQREQGLQGPDKKKIRNKRILLWTIFSTLSKVKESLEALSTTE